MKKFAHFSSKVKKNFLKQKILILKLLAIVEFRVCVWVRSGSSMKTFGERSLMMLTEYPDIRHLS